MPRKLGLLWLVAALCLLSPAAFSQNVIGGGVRGDQKAGGAPAFNPCASMTDVTYIACYRADVGVVQSGGTLSAWNDESGNGQNLMTASSAFPTYSATGFNSSYPGVSTLSSANQAIGSAAFNWASSTTLSIFILTEVNSSADISAKGMIAFEPSGGNDFTVPGIYAYANTSPSNSALVLNSSAAAAAGVPTINTPVSLGWVFNGTVITPYFNFTAQTTDAFTSAIGGSGGLFNIGNRAGTGGHVNETYAYVIIVEGVMSSTDISNLHTWTNSNWGTSF